jgi:hypothetical protein
MVEPMRRGVDASGKTPAIYHHGVDHRRAAGTHRSSIRAIKLSPEFLQISAIYQR